VVQHDRTLVLPPVGSPASAIHLIEGIEQFIGSPIFGNRQIQLQLCSPGRLSARASAWLGIGFYLGSDTLRRYTQADIRTTFASNFAHPRGIRLVLYDAEGDFDRNFAWWNQHGVLESELPFKNGRTDLLIGSGSRLDIQNINLIATLLAHSEYDGYWRLLGKQFKVEMEGLLNRHLLTGLLAAPWVREPWAQFGDDDRRAGGIRIRRIHPRQTASPSVVWNVARNSCSVVERHLGGNATPVIEI
jgi:hypothetical protein